MRVLALDVGSKTIGLAVGDTRDGIATSRGVLARAGQVADVKQVADRVDAERAQCVVVGLPLELDGREGRRARRVRVFLDALVGGLTVPVETWDERFSTAAAERTLLEADVSRAKRRTKVDGLAAQFILQGWLDARPGDAGAKAGSGAG